MGKPPAWDPTQQAEYLTQEGLPEAEFDGNLSRIASTFDPQSGRVSSGLAIKGPRILDFSMILVHRMMPLNQLVREILRACEEALESPVEIEFAMSFEPNRFGFLQVRPMAVSRESVVVDESTLTSPDVIAASTSCLGNGVDESIRDIVYVRPDTFNLKDTVRIAAEVDQMNRSLLGKGKAYLLIGFGRWGSSDPWLGIPVNWGQISGAKVIVEAMLEGMSIELSQGSHFFHNLTSFKVLYFSIASRGPLGIDWQWLESRRCIDETGFVRHVEVDAPLSVRTDGRTGRGVISRGGG